MGKYVPPPPPRDPNRGTVYVVAKDDKIPPRVLALLDERVPRQVVPASGGPWDIPDARYLVTTGQLGRAVEVEAARLRAVPVCLPRAAPWLAAKLADETAAGRPVLLWVKGADQ